MLFLPRGARKKGCLVLGLFSRTKRQPQDVAPPVQPEPVASVEPESVARKSNAGRPAKSAPRKRVSLSLEPQEFEKWQQAAGEQPVSTWARAQVQESLESESRPAAKGGADYRALRADLARVGSNLNQLMRAVNSGQVVANDELIQVMNALLVELQKTRQALRS